MIVRSTVLALLLTTFSGVASAQEPPPQTSPETSGVGGQNQPNAQNNQAFADPSLLFSGKAGAFFGLAFTKIDNEGLYASTVVNTQFNLGDVGVGLALPLNLLVENNENCCGTQTSRDSKTYYGVLRRRDWDEPQDYVKFVRFIRYGHKREPLYLLAGQIWGASIGHGTLVNRYSNSLNLDHSKFGVALDINTTYFGVETLTDYVANPALLVARAYVRPLGGMPFLRGWAIGVTGVLDRDAPRALAYNTDGSLQQDAAGNPTIAVSNAVSAGGVDTEFDLLHNSVISLIPYVDLNRIAGAGNGLHAGILADVALPIPVLDIDAQARLEYRRMQPGYIPEYFDQTYDLGRVQYAVQTPTGLSYLPKYAAAQAAQASAADSTAWNRRGYYGELALAFAGLLQIGGLYQDYEGDPQGASLGLFATFPKIEFVKLSAYYLRKNMAGIHDAFKLDDRSLLAASAAYRLFGPLYLRADYERRWVLQPGATQIQAVDKLQVGVASFVSF